MISKKNIIHPPKPNLVVRVGVTGHRPNGLAEAKHDLLKQSVREVLTYIQTVVQDIQQEVASCYTEQKPDFRIISPLAEGADRIVASEAIDLGYELQCPLPFAYNKYREDFTDAVSAAEFDKLLGKASKVLELDGSEADKGTAYYAVGKMVLGQCDLLIAVKDDNNTGGTGGTAHIVQEALNYSIPTIWIHAKEPHEISMLNPSGDWQAMIKNCLISMLNPYYFPPETVETPEHKESMQMMKSYFQEKQRKYNMGFAYRMFRDIFGDTKLTPPQIIMEDFEQAAKNEWRTGVWKDTKDFPSEMLDYLQNAFLKYFAWTDKLADYYASLYRSSFITTYLFSALAVLCALMAFILKSHYWGIAEVVLIFFIILLTVLGNKKQWHKRWIDYRVMAELLRPMRFLAPLGQVTMQFQVPAHASADDISTSWVNWYFAAIVREAGLTKAKIDQPYLTAYRGVLKNGEIMDQRNFHETNQKRYLKISHRLHKLGAFLFMLTFVAACGHLIYSNHWLTVIAAVFPVLGAALVGILFQGEFERLEQRSQSMTIKLQELYETADGKLQSFGDLQILASKTADSMLAEVLDWHQMLKIRRLNLPG